MENTKANTIKFTCAFRCHGKNWWVWNM